MMWDVCLSCDTKYLATLDKCPVCHHIGEEKEEVKTLNSTELEQEEE